MAEKIRGSKGWGLKQDFKISNNNTPGKNDFDFNLSQLVMIAFGGIIGAGIFVASGTPIRLAGPGAVVSYLLGGVIVGLIMTILGEMAVAEPSTGSFSYYANKHLGPMVGFITGWMYLSSGIFSMATEVTAAALLSKWWFPHMPLWAFSLFYSVLVTLINFMDLKGFGKAESWLSSIKVITLILFILIGAFIITISGNFNASVPKWEEFAPAGWFGIYSSMLLVIFAYAGMQNMIIAAAKVTNPSKKIPRCILISIIAVIILYAGSIAVIVTLVPWNSVGTTSSPFVIVLERLGIPYASSILNFIVLSAVLSTMNTTMFGTTRMLQSLSSRNEAPEIFIKTNRAGVPTYALIAISSFLSLAVFLAYILPHNAFIYVSCSSTFITLFNWIIIVITYLSFKRHTGHKLLANPRDLLKSILTLVLILAVVSSIPLVPQQIPGMIAGSLLLMVFLLVYLQFFRGKCCS